MKARGVLEEVGLPVNVDALVEVAKGVVVYPEDAIVNLLGAGRVIVQGLPEVGGPALHVTLREPALPPQVAPRVLQHQHSFALLIL